MAYPPYQQAIIDKIGPTWCFTHSEPMPCASCAAMPPFEGRCFDCKREYATEKDTDTESCDCYHGCRVRRKSIYRYP